MKVSKLEIKLQFPNVVLPQNEHHRAANIHLLYFTNPIELELEFFAGLPFGNIFFWYKGMGKNTTEKEFNKVNEDIRCVTKLIRIDQGTFKEMLKSMCINQFKQILIDPCSIFFFSNQIFSPRNQQMLLKN